eukprot:GEMP01020485.1.p1 GENE.GEMP01020485.1~~GEMP01020485.1.p1  ORF type:complete len:491 (+),score=106.61 GEMP01020485.1:72-1544(+)
MLVLRCALFCLARASCPRSEAPPEGWALLHEEEWAHVHYLNSFASDMALPSREMLWMYELFQRIDPQLDAAAAACPFGVATILTQALEHIEERNGREVALSVHRYLVSLIQSHDPEGWNVDVSWYRALPMLLGAVKTNATMCDKVKIYVYDTGPRMFPTLKCVRGMEGVEVLLHRFVLSSPCRTTDPRRADYFFVPFYANCHQRESAEPILDPQLDRYFIDVLDKLEYFDAYRRRDHMFLFAHDDWGFPSWQDHVARSVLLAVETNPLNQMHNSTEHCLDCFDARKDVVIPGHTDYWSMEKLRKFALPLEHREYLYCFHGALQHELYNTTFAAWPFDRVNAQDVRTAITQLRHPKGSVGPHVTPTSRYFERMGQCRFCLIPKGVAYTNGRLLEAIFAQCIPVVLSDALRLSFPFLPWDKMVIRWPMRDVHALPGFLDTMSEATMTEMRHAMAKYECWLDWYSTDPACSPYEAILKMLPGVHRMPNPDKGL